MLRKALALLLLGLVYLTAAPQKVSAGGLLDPFGLFSRRPVRSTPQPRLELERHPRYGMWSPANRQRMFGYEFQSNFGRPYQRTFGTYDPWVEPFAYPGWARSYQR